MILFRYTNITTKFTMKKNHSYFSDVLHDYFIHRSNKNKRKYTQSCNSKTTSKLSSKTSVSPRKSPIRNPIIHAAHTSKTSTSAPASKFTEIGMPSASKTSSEVMRPLVIGRGKSVHFLGWPSPVEPLFIPLPSHWHHHRRHRSHWSIFMLTCVLIGQVT